MIRKISIALPALAAALLLLPAGCRHDMYDRYAKRPDGFNGTFADENASRPRLPDTVTRDQLGTTAITEATNSMTSAPYPITMQVLQRGRERFNIDCSPCHGILGDGNGMVAMRGFPHPPNYHSDRLLRAPIGHFVYVMTNGYGVMFSYADRVSPRDRWAIAAYIRALQIAAGPPVPGATR